MNADIYNFLADQPVPVKTLQIAKVVIGPEATKKDVNPVLYAMERNGVLTKVCKENGGDPRWTICLDNITQK